MSQESGPPVHPEALLAELDLQALHELPSLVSGPWHHAIRHERVARKRSLQRLRDYFPEQIETPEFVDVPTYLEQTRAVNRTGRFATDRGLLPEEGRIAVAQAWDALAVRAAAVRARDGVHGHPMGQMVSFYANNLLRLIGAARASATSTFGSLRDQMLRSYLPGIPLKSEEGLSRWAKTSSVTGAQVREAETAVLSLQPYAADCPAFTQLSPAQQADIQAAFAVEWHELVTLVNAVDSQLLRQTVILNTPSLAYRSVEDLKTALQAAPEVESTKVCQAFLRFPLEFDERVARLKKDVERQRLQEAWVKTQAAAAQAKSAELRLTENQSALRKLLADPAIKAEVQDIAEGQTIALSAPDKRVRWQELDMLINRHLELLCRAHFERTYADNKRKLSLPDWDRPNVVDGVRGDFNGAIRNLSLTRLPATAQMIAQRFGEDAPIDPQDAIHLIVTAELKSTGRKAQTILVPIIVGLRANPDLRYSAFKDLLIEGKSAAQLLVDSLIAEASVVARAVEADARYNAFRVGLPGLGKKRR